MQKAGYSIWDVKPGAYVVFECIGEDGDCISDTWAKFYKEFLPQMGYEVESETDYEIYFEKGRSGLFCELWIPVRKNNEIRYGRNSKWHIESIEILNRMGWWLYLRK